MGVNRKMKKMLCFDLDGTLVDGNSFQIYPSALEAIEKVRDEYYIALATGRDLTIDRFNQFVDVVRPNAYVHCNGALVNVDGENIYEFVFKKYVLSEIISFANIHNICIGGVINGVQYTNNPEKLKPLRRLLSAGKEFEVCNIDDILKLQVRTLGIAANEEQINIFVNHFPFLKCHAVIPNIWYDLLDQHVSKLNGLQMVLDSYNISMSDVIAFGDSMNDYELLSAAGIGVAMGNSVEKLKLIADYVTTNVDEDGIKNAIHRFCGERV